MSIFKTMIILCLLAFSNITAVADDTLPLDAFAMRESIKSVKVSPNGRRLAIMRARSLDGDYIIEVYSTKNVKKKPTRIASDKMEITRYYWASDKRLLVDLRQKMKRKDRNGSAWRYRSYLINSDGSGKWKILPNDGKAEAFSMLRASPDEILLSYDINDDRNDDIIRYNIRSGAKKTIFKGNTKFNAGLFTDKDGEVRGAVRFVLADSILEYYARVKGSSDWKKIGAYDPKSRETYGILGFDGANPNLVYISGNFGENTTGFYTYDLTTDTISEREFGLKSVDAGGVIRSSKIDDEDKLLAFTYNTGRLKRYFVDGETEALYKSVQDLFPGKHISIRSRSEDDNAMIIYTEDDTDAGTYYLLKDKSALSYLGSLYPQQSKEHLSKVKYIKFTARDGRKIPAYITFPKGSGTHPVVVLPHGGPWVRDNIVNDQWAQLLAHHGYLVIQPQYRGSTGYGLEHWKAGDSQWGLTMQDDLDDAALYLVEKGIGDKERMAMFGWSYGGYAAFVASERENNIYKCAIAGAGVADLPSLRANIHGSRIARISQRPTVEGVNPLDHVDKVNIPILVVHGDIDQRVPVKHSRDFVSKLKKYGKDYKYVEIEGLDHFSNTFSYEHKVEFYGEMLDWLGNKCFK